MKCFLKIIAIANIFLLLFPANFTWAVSDQGEAEVSLEVVSNCGNGICETEYGEDSNNCPLDCPVTPPAPPAPAPGAALLADVTPSVIFNLFISEITLTSTTISWETNEQALCQLFWGKTPGYEKEVISEAAFYRKHLTKIVNLLPATAYHFKIACQDTNKNEAETTDQQFTTLFPPDITPPTNIINFTAIPGDSQITLTWQNPPDPDFKAVKIMRSEKFYPSDPWDGITIYNNKGTSFVDTGLTNGVRYYYTAFAHDKSGNYTSGAIVSTISSAVVSPEIPPPPEFPPPEFPPVPVPPPPEIEKLILEDFDFIREGEKIPLIEKRFIELEAEKPLKISLDYEKVPEVLKTIMVTLEKDQKFFSFLLRINKEKAAYEAILLSPAQVGIYNLTLTILDYKNQALKKIEGEMKIEERAEISPPARIPFYKRINFWKWILIGLLILIVIAFLYKKIKKIVRKKWTGANL